MLLENRLGLFYALAGEVEQMTREVRDVLGTWIDISCVKRDLTPVPHSETERGLGGVRSHLRIRWSALAPSHPCEAYE